LQPGELLVVVGQLRVQLGLLGLQRRDLLGVRVVLRVELLVDGLNTR
jgi:hypothetical protein